MDAAVPPLGPEEERRADAVRRALARGADADGFVPFDRFMEIALYDDAGGYYARPESPFGPAGDFYTAARVHPLFARTLARHVRSVRGALGADRPFEIVEVGPGDGTLGASLLSALGEDPSGLVGVSYHLVERSPSLARRARERLTPVAADRGVPVVDEPAIGATGPFEGIVLANEFLDAEPARRLRWTGDAWRELGVRVRDGRVEPAESSTVPPVPDPPVPTPAEPNVIVEVSPAAESWVRSVGDHLAAGVLLALDYGAEESELVAGHPRGTLAAVRRHRSVNDFWSSPGASDLSVFVDFTRLRYAARRAGLVELAYGRQAEALGAWGFPSELEAALAGARDAEEGVRVRLAAKNLLFGFEQFRVLELAAPASAERLGALRWPAG